jgi:hypothetical protein
LGDNSQRKEAKMDSEAKVSVSLREGKIEICGSEAFVKEQLDRFQDLIDGKLSALPATPPIDVSNNSAPPAQDSKVFASKGNKYPNLIAIDDDEIKILKSIPGNSKAEKMVNAALLYLVGTGIKGESSAPCSKIRELCKHHSCLDVKNFASKLKGAKEWLIISGSGKSQTAKLTHPGNTKAHTMAAELNQS